MATNSVALSNVQPPVFDGKDFEFWRVKMETLFLSLNAKELVEGRKVEPEYGEDKKAMDAGILSIIQRALSQEVFPKIRDAKKAKEAWNILKQEFQGNSEVALEMAPANENQTNNCWRTCWGKFEDLFQHKDKGKWLEDMRGMLSLVSTMIASITFQASINPPGGVLQANGSSNTTVGDLKNCSRDVSKNHVIPCAGEAILLLSHPYKYFAFQFCNTICFAASLSVTLLLVSGVRLNRTSPIWILSMGMILTLSSLTLAYVFAMLLTCSEGGGTLVNIAFSILIWLGIVGIVTVLLTARFSVWFARKLREIRG